MFQFDDDGKNYRLDISISRPAAAPLLKSERFAMWLLARNGQAVPINKIFVYRIGPLVETGNQRGRTASATFYFWHTLPRRDLSSVVVSVDGEPAVFKIPAPELK